VLGGHARRPVNASRKDAHVQIRLTAVQKRDWQHLAERDGRTLSNWIRSVVTQAVLRRELAGSGK
jgi:hypothetical protein